MTIDTSMSDKVTCITCGGKGLVGQGPEPHLMQGRIDSCKTCAGTGTITPEHRDAMNTEKHGSVTKAPEAPADDEADKTPATPKKGFFARIFKN